MQIKLKKKRQNLLFIGFFCKVLYASVLATAFLLIIDCKYVLGCGSNVVDQLFRVQALPKPGEKGFFRRFVFHTLIFNMKQRIYITEQGGICL